LCLIHRSFTKKKKKSRKVHIFLDNKKWFFPRFRQNKGIIFRCLGTDSCVCFMYLWHFILFVASPHYEYKRRRWWFVESLNEHQWGHERSLKFKFSFFFGRSKEGNFFRVDGWRDWTFGSFEVEGEHDFEAFWVLRLLWILWQFEIVWKCCKNCQKCK